MKLHLLSIFNRNSISFKPVIKKISKFTTKNFLMGTKKMSKNEGNPKLNFFKPSDLAWNASSIRGNINI